MDKIPCIIMAGGRGTRFGSPLKFLSHICGKSVLEKLLMDSEIVCRYIVLALSKTTLRIKHICTDKYSIIDCIETSGEDFIRDLTLLLDILPKPLLMIAADVYISDNKILIDFVNRALKTSEDIVTLTIDDNGEKLVGITLFKKPHGSWRNIIYSKNSVIDIDKVDDLKNVKCSYS